MRAPDTVVSSRRTISDFISNELARKTFFDAKVISPADKIKNAGDNFQ
jgi:hypothetical protein